MRILVTSTSGTGHIHPIVPLARELQRAGHEITWATAEASCPSVERLGFRALAAGLHHTERTERFRARHLADMLARAPRERRLLVLPVVFGEIAAPVMYDDLLDVVDRVRPELVVHDAGELAAAPIATGRGIPHVSVGFGAALSDELFAAQLRGVAPVWERAGLVPTPSAISGELFLHPFPRSIDVPRADGPAAELRTLPADDAASAAEPPWAASFGRERPGVYVTFGTELGGAAPWAAIFDAADGLDVDVVATVGGHVDPASLGPWPTNVRVERYVPQRFLLGRAALVVSHAGAGTLVAAASAGTPLLDLPLTADNWDNADLFARHGAARTLEPDERDVASIARSVAEMLGDPTYAAAAARLQQQFVAMPHPRELVPAVERLL